MKHHHENMSLQMTEFANIVASVLVAAFYRELF
jgi:hypothetical protein